MSTGNHRIVITSMGVSTPWAKRSYLSCDRDGLVPVAMSGRYSQPRLATSLLVEVTSPLVRSAALNLSGELIGISSAD